MSPVICITFVCQAGDLETKALLLAASIREHHPPAQVELIAAVPDIELWGAVATETLVLLEELAVRVEYIASPFGMAYPIGNKIAAIGISTEAQTTVFLDSDILCLRPMILEQLVTTGLLAKPADFNTFDQGEGRWPSVYALFNSPAPKQKILSGVSGELMAPYFNAGVVAVANGARFSEVWQTCAKEIDNAGEIDNKRPWLDQIALPIAAQCLGYRFEILSERYNFPCHVKALSAADLPVLCHYHWPSVAEQELTLSRVICQLAQKYPYLNSRLNSQQDWLQVLQSGFRAQSRRRLAQRLFHPRKASTNNVLITGMPRSGTSLLCNILHRIPDTVIVNEPDDVFPALDSDNNAFAFGVFYRSLRCNILAGRPIVNKLTEEGVVVEDTRLEDCRREYIPAVTRPDFMLGTKNPLAYLARLRELCNAHPEMPKIVLIRHPLDVIASWKSSFVHLRDVDLEQFPFGGLADGLLDAAQRLSLEQIAAEPSLELKRALLWNHFARLVWRDREKIILIRYEDLVGQPDRVLKKLLRQLKWGPWSNKLGQGVRVRQDRSPLSELDYQSVASLCGAMMEVFGYSN